MIRITGPTQIPSSIPSGSDQPLSLNELPSSLPAPSHFHPLPGELAKLFLPEAVNITALGLHSPLAGAFLRLEVSTFLGAIVEGGFMNPKGRIG